MKVFVTGTRGIPNVMGGVETHCEELMPRLAARGAEVTVARRAGYVSDGLMEWKGVRLVDLPSPKSKAFEAIVHTWRAVRRAKREGADFVHIHAIGPGLAVPLAKAMGLKVVFTHHGFDYRRAKWGRLARLALRLGERVAAAGADEIIVISSEIERTMRERFGRADCHLIPNGAPPPKSLSAEREAELLAEMGLADGNYFFAACRFVPEKRLHDLVEAYAAAGCARTRLVLAGDTDFEDAYSRRLKERARAAGAVLPGFVRGEKLEALWRGAKAFFLASSHEGLPVALLEAMRHGVPAWVSDIEATREVQLAADRYFAVGDVGFLVRTMRELDAGPLARESYDLSRYDWERIADETMGVYRKAAGK
jgi:glycosyltransferase involved in cell wall biosynthesis